MSILPFNISNPGIYISGLLTAVEQQFVTDIVNQSPSQGQVLTWHNGAPVWRNPTGGGGGGGDVNVQSDWNESDTNDDAYIKNKPIIPTDNNQLSNGAGYITGISSGDVTTALGFTPYSSSNPSGYLTDINSQVLNDLGDVNALSPSNNQVLSWDNTTSRWIPKTISTGGDVNVQSDWNEGNTGNDAYIRNKPTIPTNNNQLTNGRGYITGISSGDVTTALGFTPYNNSNPNGFITNITGEVLNDLSDVNANSPTDGQTLTYDTASSKWIAKTPAGSISVGEKGSAPVSPVTKVTFDGATVTDKGSGEVEVAVDGVVGDSIADLDSADNLGMDSLLVGTQDPSGTPKTVNFEISDLWELIESNPRVSTATTTATLTPNYKTAKNFYITAQAGALTIATPTNMVAGSTINIIIKDNGTARALTFNANYKFAEDNDAPTTTVVGEKTQVVVHYDGSHYLTSSTNHKV